METSRQLPEDAHLGGHPSPHQFPRRREKGASEFDEGKGIAHQKVKEEFAEWFAC